VCLIQCRADPGDHKEEWMQNDRGCSYTFNDKAAKSFMGKNNMNFKSIQELCDWLNNHIKLIEFFTSSVELEKAFYCGK
jgi:hypothetical protein